MKRTYFFNNIINAVLKCKEQLSFGILLFLLIILTSVKSSVQPEKKKIVENLTNFTLKLISN